MEPDPSVFDDIVSEPFPGVNIISDEITVIFCCYFSKYII